MDVVAQEVVLKVEADELEELVDLEVEVVDEDELVEVEVCVLVELEEDEEVELCVDPVVDPVLELLEPELWPEFVERKTYAPPAATTRMTTTTTANAVLIALRLKDIPIL